MNITYIAHKTLEVLSTAEDGIKPELNAYVSLSSHPHASYQTVQIDFDEENKSATVHLRDLSDISDNTRTHLTSIFRQVDSKSQK